MAAVLNGQEDATRFKLFGTTIALQGGEAKEESNKTDEGEEKKQDIIPCPRCKSMETKFCYFNNYNVNQPRHFCKGCQRYWTAGGSQRNVPVGAGRRKAKPACRGVAGFSEGCLFDSNEVNQFDLDIGVMEEWHTVVKGGYRQVFPDAKRQRNGSNGKSQAC